MKSDNWALIFAAFCGCISLVSIGLVIYPTTTATSDFEVSPNAVQEMGKIRNKTITSLKYTLRNDTKQTFKIIDISTTCGCTTAGLTEKEIAPGKLSEVTLAFDSRDYRGKVHAHAHVSYIDEEKNERHSLELHANGEIDPVFYVEPEKICFLEKKKSTLLVAVRPNYEKDITVQSLSCDKRFFTAKIVDQAHNLTHIEISFDPIDFYKDAGPAHLSIKTNSQIIPVASIPLEVLE